MAGLTSNTAMDDVLTTWLNKKFVSDLEFALQHQKFTSKAIIPRGQGGNIGRFIEFAAPVSTGYSGAGSSSITEGSTTANEITSVTTTPTNITIAEFGEFIKVGTMYEYAAISGTREKLEKRLRDGALVSVDSNVRVTAATSTTSFFATAAQSGGTTTGPSSLTALGAASLIGAKKVLFANLAKGFEGIPGHPQMHMAAVLTPQQELDVVTEVTTLRVYWSNAVVNVPGPMGQEKFVNGYIGSVYGVAVYTTNNFATVSYTSTAQVGFMYADGGVGAMAFEDMNPRIVLNDVNSPYKNVNSIAWHLMFNSGLISSSRVVKLYSTGA